MDTHTQTHEHTLTNTQIDAGSREKRYVFFIVLFPFVMISGDPLADREAQLFYFQF